MILENKEGGSLGLVFLMVLLTLGISYCTGQLVLPTARGRVAADPAPNPSAKTARQEISLK